MVKRNKALQSKYGVIDMNIPILNKVKVYANKSLDFII